ncbi:Sulfate permease 2 [Polyrhizophydium stewartii]|uniref:Sulfate permease 2 n=1 Tax=Polyrhizophydium stewartii TaxID=2732419 RepID=A0ABR4NHG8_9FUNG|nr:hypothetical protein HK105_004343 [Polyrhizophydium stewartii]
MSTSGVQSRHAARRYPSQTEQLVKAVKSGARNLPHNAGQYLSSLFPIAKWIGRYNPSWFFGDAIAGATVAILIVPQALAYARLASLPVEYGLYTSFVGTFIYCLFATSKDVTIGATAVLSLVTGQLLSTYNSDKSINPVVFASGVAFLTGVFETIIGLLRLGIVVDFIPVPVIIGFTTGSGITIIVGQVAGLLGITGIDTNEAAYKVFYNTVKNLGNAKIDAAFGVAALVTLLAFKFGTRALSRRGHGWAVWVGYAANAIVLIAIAIASWLYNRGASTPRIRVVGTVPSGLSYLHVPTFPNLSTMLQATVTASVIGILEHIAVTKSFGRVNGYTPDANQEVVALGITNLIGSFFGGFPATGSFSRSAIKSRSGVRTPLAGVYTGVLVLLSIYFLTPLFYHIPSSGLSAVIMNAITDLISPPSLLVQLYRIEILDFVSFAISFVFTIFFSIEIGIYVSVSFAVLVLLVRVARPRYEFLVRSADDGAWISHDEARQLEIETKAPGLPTPVLPTPVNTTADIKLSPPGIYVVRIEESLTYPNSTFLQERVREWVFKHTAFGGKILKPSERLWCDNLEEDALRSQQLRQERSASGADADEDIWFYRETADTSVALPRLRAIVFDLAAVNSIDATGLQALVDLKRDIDRFAGRHVPFYFAHVRTRFARVLTYFAELLPATNEELAPVSSVTNESGSARTIVRTDVETGSASVSRQSLVEDVRARERNPTRFFRTIDSAILAALAETQGDSDGESGASSIAKV